MARRGALALAIAAVALLAPAQPAPAATPYLRVGLASGASEVLFASSVPAELVDDRGRKLMKLNPLDSWVARAEGGRLQATGPNSQSVVVAGGMRLVASGGAGIPLVFARNRWYRGALEFEPTGGGVTAVNVIPLEQYLYGVVPAEMPNGWPAESLKSQAVAARSYALANLGKHKSRGYDLCGTDECQVYQGAAAEATSTNMAVDATRGVVVTFGGKVIPAYFHSSSGGYTENSEEVWMRKLPYIRAVPDFDQKSPHFTWYKNVAAGSLADGLARSGVNIGAIIAVNPLSRSYSGRVKEVQVVGTEGTKVVGGETFRLAAGLNSTLFNVAPVGSGQPSEFAFAGRGWGHGLGLSQWGAKTLGEMGYSYTQILSHYYPGAQLSRR